MSRPASGQFLKALLLGFFCCLSAPAWEDGFKAELLALRLVHPQSDTLAPLVASGKKKSLKGFTIYSKRVLNQETGQANDSQPILLSTAAIVTEADVEMARRTAEIGVMHVRLTEAGGRKLNAATETMKLGQDRMAVVVRGECFIAHTVQAVLSQDFVITGLENKAESQELVKALNKPAQK